MNGAGSEDVSCKLCRRICSNLPLYNVITLPCRWTNSAHTRFRYSLCISTETMTDILKSRKWTDVCKRAPYYLLRLRHISLSRLHESGVGIETCNAFVEDLKKRGVNTAKKIFHMTDDQIDRAEFFLDLHRSKKGEINLPSREKLMRIMNDDFPSGGYALVKRTFDRLVKIGFDLDAADFILVDEEEEEALEAFRRMRVPVEE